eukprot:15578717-Heterocapsa_arctica.AAC.1
MIFSAVHGAEGVVEIAQAALIPLEPFIIPAIVFRPFIVRNLVDIGALSELALALARALALVEV